MARRPAASVRGERGIILLWTLMVLTVLIAVIASGFLSDAALDRSTRMELSVRGQARAVAEAGIVDAFAWFRRQSVQPVTAFAPRRDLAASPPLNETDDPTVGLVREFEIAPNLWARYEIRLFVPAEPFVDENRDGLYGVGESYTDSNGNGRHDDAGGTRDVSSERGLPSAGAVWRIESHGFVYDRRRRDVPLGTSPNDRVSATVVATEIRRLTITPPSAAALCVARGADAVIGTRGRVMGGSSAGIAYANATGSPTLLAGAEVTGAPGATSQPDYAGGVEDVFGVPVAELRSMADVSTSDVAAVPSPLGDYTLVVVDGNATFDGSHPLRGTGAVVVLGDATLASGSNSFFNGILYVSGNLTVRAPCYLRGVVIVGGRVDVRGTGGDYAEVQYDDGVILEILRFLGQYRHSKTVFAPSAPGEEQS